jgi:DNA-binding LytR/AlgR family response regulator
LSLVQGGRAPAGAPRPEVRAATEISANRIVARRKSALVFMGAREVWAFEANARLAFVHSAHGKLDIDVSLTEIEGSALGHLFVRVHRSWLASLALVKALDYVGGETQLFVSTNLVGGAGVQVPVSRERAKVVRELLLSGAIGVRRPREIAAEAIEGVTPVTSPDVLPPPPTERGSR